MTVLEKKIFYNPDDSKFYGDRVRTEFILNDEICLVYFENAGDRMVDDIFRGYMKCCQHIYGDSNVKIVITQVCCKDWDDVEKTIEDYGIAEDEGDV